jgi:hypothetical protein
MRWTLSGFVPSSNVSAIRFSVRGPCETTTAGTTSAGGAKQPWASAVGAGADAKGLAVGSDELRAVVAVAVAVGGVEAVASAVDEPAGLARLDATIAPTMTIATAPANARKMRVRRRWLGWMITFWPQKPPLLARRPNVLEGVGWWATLDSNQ